MDFRTRLRNEIEYSGLLDKEVAALAGVSKRAIDSYVGSQACMPSADVAVRLANVLNTSVEYLVNGVKEIDDIHLWGGGVFKKAFGHYKNYRILFRTGLRNNRGCCGKYWRKIQK